MSITCNNLLNREIVEMKVAPFYLFLGVTAA